MHPRVGYHGMFQTKSANNRCFYARRRRTGVAAQGGNRRDAAQETRVSIWEVVHFLPGCPAFNSHTALPEPDYTGAIGA